jgi:hypothetical protein
MDRNLRRIIIFEKRETQKKEIRERLKGGKTLVSFHKNCGYFCFLHTHPPVSPALAFITHTTTTTSSVFIFAE